MSITAGPNVSTNGLILYFDAANSRSYAGSGNTFSSIFGNSINGTLTNGPVFDSNNLGSFSFDGNNDLVLLPASTAILPLSNFSWEIVFKTPSMGVGMSVGGLVSLNYGMTSYVSSAGALFFTVYDGSSAALQMNYAGGYVDNQWHHAVFVIDGSNGYIYVDGVLRSTQSATISNRTGTNIWSYLPMRFPDDPNDADRKFKGNVSFVRIYNRGLSDSEVASNFNATRGRYGI